MIIVKCPACSEEYYFAEELETVFVNLDIKCTACSEVFVAFEENEVGA